MITLGQRILGYTLQDVIGDGGMATVYRATNSLGKQKAVKVLKPEFTRDPELRQRFHQEAQIMVRLGEQTLHICQVDNLDITDEYVALVMEYLQGQNLSDYLRHNGAISVEQLIEWMEPVLLAVGLAHRQNVVHRDLKPSNLFLTTGGQIKVLDFGIAKVMTSVQDLTKTQQVVGSPRFMSPEQILTPRKVDHRSDIYALGVIIWTLLAGKRPYEGAEEAGSDYMIQTRIVQEPLAALTGQAAMVNDVIAKATAKSADDRYQNCQLLLEALTAVLADAVVEVLPETHLDRGETTLPLHRETFIRQPVAVGTNTLPPPPPKRIPNRRSRLVTLGISAAIGVLTAIGYLTGGDNHYRQGQLRYQSGNYEEALSLFRQAADENNAEAKFSLGILYEKGQGVEKDFVQAVDWYRKAAEQGSANGACNLGVMYDQGRGVERDYAQALTWLRKSAEQGNADGQSNLGTMYENGQGVEKDYAQALNWYRKAAEQGNADGQCNLGFMYDNGYGVEKDPTQAVSWYRKAAEQGNADGQSNLGTMYENGQGVEKDYAQALNWYRKAAEQGNADGQCNLGRLYANALGVEKDYAQALNWYRKAAEQGNADGQSSLGMMYEGGYGVEKDYTQAIALFRKAAEQGNADGQFRLGAMYTEGLGVEKDYTQAISWYRKSAEQGNANGQFALGTMYASAYGVSQDYAQAVSWFEKAAAQGNAVGEYDLGVMYENGYGIPKQYMQAVNWYKKAAQQGNENAQTRLKALNVTW